VIAAARRTVEGRGAAPAPRGVTQRVVAVTTDVPRPIGGGPARGGPRILVDADRAGPADGRHMRRTLPRRHLGQ
jgi:hypothetical protein